MMELHSPFNTCPQTLSKSNANYSQISPWLSPLAYLLGSHLLLPSFFGRIEVTGQKNIPESGPVILAPTHRARWDSLLLPYAAGRCVTGRDLRFMVSINECVGLQGWFVRRMGGFPVDPKHPSVATLRYSVELLRNQEMLVIYPEGGIFRDRQLHPLKPGIARLALSAQSTHPDLSVNILPININYSQPYPNWGTEVSIHIGQAIAVAPYVHGCVKKDAKLLTADLTKALKNLIYNSLEVTTSTLAQVPNS